MERSMNGMNGKKRDLPGRWWSLLIVFSLALVLGNSARAATAVAGGLTRERTANVGETYRGVIVLKNDGDKPQEIKIYQTDYLFFSDGTTQYGEPGKLDRSSADWVSFSPSRLTVPGKGSAAVDYTVEVPSDRSMKGTYWSMLMVELIGEDSPEAARWPGDGRLAVGIRRVSRLGVQVVTHIEETGSPRPYFLEIRLLGKGERGRVLEVDLENRGERWMTPDVWVEPYDGQGTALGRFDGGRKRIYPGTSVRYEIDLSSLPDGDYRALVVADAGDDRVFGANYTLRLHKAPSGE